MHLYIKWSWLTYLGMMLWISLVVNDWNLERHGGLIHESLDTQIPIENIPESKAEEHYSVVSDELLIRKYLQELADANKTTTLELPLELPLSSNETDNEPQVETEPISSPDLRIEEPEIVEPEQMNEEKSYLKRFWNIILFILLATIYTFMQFGSEYIQSNKQCIPGNQNKPEDNQQTQKPNVQRLSKIPKYQFKRSQSTTNLLSASSPEINLQLEPIIADAKNDQSIQFKDAATESNQNQTIEAQKMNQNLENELQKLIAEYSAERETMNRKLDAVLAQKKDLSKQLTIALKENHLMKSDFDALIRERNEIDRKFNKIKTEYRKIVHIKHALTEQINTLEGENINLKQILESNRIEQRKQEQKIIQLQKEIFKLRARLYLLVRSKKIEKQNEKSEKNLLKESEISDSSEIVKSINSPNTDLYENVQNRLKIIGKNIKEWENNCNNKIIAEIYQSCCDSTSCDGSSEGDLISNDGLPSDVLSTNELAQINNPSLDTISQSSSIPISGTSDDLSKSCDESASTTSYHDISTTELPNQTSNYSALNTEIKFDKNFEKLIEKLDRTIITEQQTKFLRQYFQQNGVVDTNKLTEEYSSLTEFGQLFNNENTTSPHMTPRLNKNFLINPTGGIYLDNSMDKQFPSQTLVFKHLYTPREISGHTNRSKSLPMTARQAPPPPSGGENSNDLGSLD